MCLHRGLKLLNVQILLFGDLQHALVDFVFDLLGEFEFFAFLNQQLLIDEHGNHLGAMLLHLSGRLRLGHAVLLQRLDPLFHFTLQLRERDHTVVHLRNYFINDDGLAFLGVSQRRRKNKGADYEQRSDNDF